METHDTHHPTSTAIAYEDQREAALDRTYHFLKSRLPKYLGYFEGLLVKESKTKNENEEVYLLGDFSIADLFLFQTVHGLKFAFPTGMESLIFSSMPNLKSHFDLVGGRENISSYLQSERRTEYGDFLFRYYPELDEIANKVVEEQKQSEMKEDA